jgi:hypothetical protein
MEFGGVNCSLFATDSSGMIGCMDSREKRYVSSCF